MNQHTGVTLQEEVPAPYVDISAGMEKQAGLKRKTKWEPQVPAKEQEVTPTM